jgi:Holliday junction resolvase
MLKQKQRYKNNAERAFVEKAKSEGWNISKRGWPDFFCEKDGRFMCVEVKPQRADGREALKFHQIKRMEWLQFLGAECFVGIEGDLIPFKPEEEWEKYNSLKTNRTSRKYEEDFI